MAQNRTSRARRTSDVVLLELPTTGTPGATPAPPEPVVFVTNAVRRRGGLRTRAEQRRPVLLGATIR